MPDWASSWSTSVVLPWSTWAMMAMLRSDMGFLKGVSGSEEGELGGERRPNRQLELALCDPADAAPWPSCCAMQPRYDPRRSVQDPEISCLLIDTIMKRQVFCLSRLRCCALHRTLDL